MPNVFSRRIKINDRISIIIPTLGQVIDSDGGDAFSYFDCIFPIIATPYDMMVQLYDNGIDYTKITDFDLFCLLFEGIKNADMSLVFEDLDLSGFNTVINQETREIALKDSQSDTVIDRVIHSRIADAIRSIVHMERNYKKPGNEAAFKYMIERARKKQKKMMNQKQDSQLESAIVALVNNSNFPYNYDTIRDITINQFYLSLEQISHKIRFDNTMHGYYAGTVKMEDLSQADKTWILNLNGGR